MESNKEYQKTKENLRNPFWILRKFLRCIKEMRLPSILENKKSGFYPLFLAIHTIRPKMETMVYNLRSMNRKQSVTGKYLYALPVGKNGKKLLEKVIRKFGHEKFDYLIFAYDDTEFSEEIFKKCTFIHEKGLKWQFIKKYATPEYCAKYDYIFLWDDDIDIEGFSCENFIKILDRNNLECAQPSLSKKSYYYHSITLKDEKFKVGRYTDFVEIMVPVFKGSSWAKFWNMLEADYNFWGYGYDLFARSYCGFKSMGIIDCETVIHTRPIGTHLSNVSDEEYDKFKETKRKHRMAKIINYGKLK